MGKKWWNSDNCNVNQWDIYNSIADTYMKMHINISCHAVFPNKMYFKTYKAMQ